MRRVQAIAVVAMAPFLSPLWPDGWGQQMSLGPAFAYAAPFDADLVYAEASGQGAALSPDHYSARWFILQMRDLSLRHQPKQAMQLAYLGLQTHPQSPVLQLALANLGYATGRCDWVRAHLLEIRRNAPSAKFRQLGRDLIHRCFGGWQHSLGLGGLGRKYHADGGRSDVTSIASQPGSRIHSYCRALANLCNPDRRLSLQPYQRATVNIWMDVTAISHRSTGQFYYDQLALQLFRGIPVKGKFQASGVSLGYLALRPLSPRLAGFVRLGVGSGEFNLAGTAGGVSQNHTSAAVGLRHLTIQKNLLTTGLREMHASSPQGDTHEIRLQMGVERMVRKNLRGNLSTARTLVKRDSGLFYPNSVKNRVAASAHFLLAETPWDNAPYRLNAQLSLSRISDQFAKALPYLASPHVEITREVTFGLTLMPKRQDRLKIEFSVTRNNFFTTDLLQAKKEYHASIYLYLMKFYDL
jgi:hypothetical protein